MEEKESVISGSSEGLSGTPSPVVSGGLGGGPVAPPPPPPLTMNLSGERSVGVVSGGGVGTMGVVSGSGEGGSGDMLLKKKRGRPRKYDADGNLRVPYMSPTQPPSGFSLSPSPSDYSKRGRGRPPGSGNWQLLASLGELFANTAGGDFTPHIVTVNTGEDVAGKILSFSQKGPRGICILSANGSVSNVTIRQPGSSGGLLTYEGRFEILSLTGSFTVSENGGMRSRTGGLSVSLAGPDGRVIGGGIAGLLLAASPIQMVVGSFMPYGYKAHKRKHQYYDSRMSPVTLGASNSVTVATPISQAAPSGSIFPIPTSQAPSQGHGEGDNSTSTDRQNNHNATPADSAEWNDSEPISAQRPSPDINLSVPLE
ncbi:hypothetical protein NMG60_11001393 [Bertholletia excelsa]